MRKTNRPLPKMTVEKRESTTDHGIPPVNTDPQHIAIQLGEAIQLNSDAKLYEIREMMIQKVTDKLAPFAWRQTTTDILIKYMEPFVPGITREEIIEVGKEVLQVNGFDELARWVQDDMCGEVFNRMLKYVIKEGQPEKTEKGFIKGNGFGYLSDFVRIGKKNIQKAFDAKYFRKGLRPLYVLFEEFGLDLTLFANKINPGHYTDPQGHNAKSLSAVEAIRYRYDLDEKCNRRIFIGGLMFGFGRDGNLIHKPDDAINSGYVTDLKEFKS